MSDELEAELAEIGITRQTVREALALMPQLSLTPAVTLLHHDYAIFAAARDASLPDVDEIGNITVLTAALDAIVDYCWGDPFDSMVLFELERHTRYESYVADAHLRDFYGQAPQLADFDYHADQEAQWAEYAYRREHPKMWKPDPAIYEMMARMEAAAKQREQAALQSDLEYAAEYARQNPSYNLQDFTDYGVTPLLHDFLTRPDDG